MRQFAPALLLLTVATQAAPSQVEWRWDRDFPPGCALRQVFAADGTTLQISRTPGNDQTTVRIGAYSSPDLSLRTLSENLHSGSITFGTGERADAEIWVISYENGGRDVAATSYDQDFLNKFAKASVAEISNEKLGTVRASLRSAAAAVEALRSCEDSRMREWGIDPVAWRALKARPDPVKPPNEWLTPDDYPVKALKYDLQGWVIARLEVGTDGRVNGCKSINRELYRGFRDRICDVMKKRARFHPALDSHGNAVTAPFMLIIRFVMA